VRRSWALLTCLLLLPAACGDDAADTTEATTTSEAAAVTTTEAETTTTTQAVTTTAAAETTTSQAATTTTEAPPPEIPLTEVTEVVAAKYGAAVTCTPFADGPLTAGSVVTCLPSPLPLEGQYPELTALVMDGSGTIAVAIGGLFHMALNPSIVAKEVPAGLNCTNLLAPDSEFSSMADYLDGASRYFGTVLYWFLEGRPSPLMDIDENGIPCETLYESDTVIDVWDGGFFGRLPAFLDDIVLANNGLGVVPFGTEAEETIAIMSGLLGPPLADTGYGPTGCDGAHREVTWPIPAPDAIGVDTELRLHFTDFERAIPEFTDYRYSRAFDPDQPFYLPGALWTPEGIGIGSSTTDVYAAYPEVE